MLKLGRIASISRFYGPFIGQKLRLVGSGINHRFYGEYHPRFDELSGILRCFVVHIWFLVESNSDSVSCILTNYSVSMPFRVSGNLVSDISEPIPWVDFLESDFKARPCHIYQVSPSFRYFSDREHSRSVPEILIHDGGHIDIDDITFFENFLLGGDSVTYDIIGGYAGVSRISMVPDARRNPAIVEDVGIANLIELLGGDPWFYIGFYHSQN